VTPIIRAVTLPGSHEVIGALTVPGIRHLVTGALRGAARSGAPALRDLDEIAGIIEGLDDPHARRALKHVVSACVDLRGQIISMADRAYLTREMPMCVVWGSDDHVIPTRHAENVRRLAPTAEVKIVGDAGHFPHKDHPDEFVRTVEHFIRTHEPAVYHRGRWRALLKNGAPAGAVIPDSRVVTIA
jgi:pimeloyl-ACP methyl ester carboxylesterase